MYKSILIPVALDHDWAGAASTVLAGGAAD